MLENQPPLYTAIIKNDIERVELLLKQGADLKVRIENHRELDLVLSLLDVAIDLKNEKIVRLLLSQGADPNLSYNKSSPLSWAIGAECEPILKLLLAYGADPNLQTIELHHSTILYEAVCEGQESEVRLLLTYGANPNLGNKYNSPLCMAAKRVNSTDLARKAQFASIVLLLLEAGADPTEADANPSRVPRYSATDYAKNNGEKYSEQLYKAVMKLHHLEKYGESPVYARALLRGSYLFFHKPSALLWLTDHAAYFSVEELSSRFILDFELRDQLAGRTLPNEIINIILELAGMDKIERFKQPFRNIFPARDTQDPVETEKMINRHGKLCAAMQAFTHIQNTMNVSKH